MRKNIEESYQNMKKYLNEKMYLMKIGAEQNIKKVISY